MSLVNNTRWVAVSQAAKISAQVISLVLLARIIPPAEYGLLAMATVIVNFGYLFRDFGTAAALIQRPVITEALKNAVFTFNLLMGAAVAILIILLSPLIAHYFGQPRLTPVLCLLALTFPLASSASSHLALLERDSKFKKIAGIEASSSLIATVVGVMAALAGWGVYSLAAQALCNALLSTVQIWLASAWRPSWRKARDLGSIGEIFSFSGNLAAFNFIIYLARNTDTWIISYYMSTALLGAYNLATRIMMLPMQTLTFVVGRSLLPVLSRDHQDSAKVTTTFLAATAGIAFLAFPLMTGIMVLREPFVTVVFGPQWGLTAELLLWLAPAGMLQAINSTSSTVFIAKGETRLLFWMGVLNATLMIMAFLAGTLNGITELVRYYLVANLAYVSICTCVVFNCMKSSPLMMIKNLLPSIIGCLLMALAMTQFAHFLPQQATLLSLLLHTAFGSMVYLLVMALLSPATLKRFARFA